MPPLPTLRTERLLLRAFRPEDAAVVQRLEGTLRQHVIKRDRLEDLTQYAILRTDLPRG